MTPNQGYFWEFEVWRGVGINIREAQIYINKNVKTEKRHHVGGGGCLLSTGGIYPPVERGEGCKSKRGGVKLSLCHIM